MAEIPGILVVEPSAQQGKHRAAGVFVRKEPQLDVESVKGRLKEIRHYTRSNHHSLLDGLKQILGQYTGVKLSVAADAGEAVSYIAKVAGDAGLVSLNKSNVLVNELRPGLNAAGLQTYLRYFTEFKNFDHFEKKVEDYWSLPGMHGRGLVESFDVTKNVAWKRQSPEVRDYAAVLSVNAISAEDGSVFFLQHMSNISKDLEQARKIILVVSIEKIVKDRDAARFHTRSMGIFGLESVLLDLAPKESEEYNFDALPAAQDGQARELHVLILDNGRSKLLNNGYSDLFLCIDCRACARQCPIGLHVLKEKGMVFSPKNYLMGFLQGWLPSVEACLHCTRCAVECPVEIDIPTLIWKAQTEYYAKHGRSLKKRLLDDPELLAKVGSWTAPISNWAMGIPGLKSIMQLVAGIHRNANLPAFHHETFKKWLEGDRGDRHVDQ